MANLGLGMTIQDRTEVTQSFPFDRFGPLPLALFGFDFYGFSTEDPDDIAPTLPFNRTSPFQISLFDESFDLFQVGISDTDPIVATFEEFARVQEDLSNLLFGVINDDTVNIDPELIGLELFN